MMMMPGRLLKHTQPTGPGRSESLHGRGTVTEKRTGRLKLRRRVRWSNSGKKLHADM